ncbi:SMI1/KNR4 family protein [Streptomyces sp. NPDC102467]|uniref:SMI1/KNR4 family protein n=1 Tax=Streptomyces sp. NPDC102467 TaxID=3366179 RepID=UPI00380CBDD7
MWRELTSEFPGVGLQDSAGEASLAAIEQCLGQTIPQPLRDLLLETNGITDDYGTDIIWSAEKILSGNEGFRLDGQFRDLYQAFDSLMFFGDNGGGDQFAFIRRPTRDDEIFVWDHETDSRTWVAGSLENYLRNALGSDGEDWYRD